jgi:PAS domain S-box-containing protein
MADMHQNPEHPSGSTAEERSRSIEERRAYYVHLEENAYDAFIATDENLLVKVWNRGAERMYGVRVEEALGRDAREVVILEMSDEELAGAFREIAESGRLRAEQVQHREDGAPIYVDSLTIAMRDEQGEITGYLAINRDITERKRAESELLALKDELGAEVSAMSRLRELSTRLLAAAELQPVLEEILDASIELQGADFGNIQLYDPETGTLEIVAHRGFEQEFLEYFSDTDENAASGRAMKQGERVVIEDVEKDARFETHRRIAASASQGGWDEMVEAIRGGRLERIDPDRCREVVWERFSVEAMVDGYEKAFEKILALQSTSRAGQGKPAARAAS